LYLAFGNELFELLLSHSHGLQAVEKHHIFCSVILGWFFGLELASVGG
jgi:hypothetical protein